MTKQYIYIDPSTKLEHTLSWPDNDETSWTCSCGGEEDVKWCNAVASLMHSFDYDKWSNYKGVTYRVRGREVFTLDNKRMVDLGATSKGDIFDMDGAC